MQLLSMRHLFTLAITIPLAAITLSADPQTHTYAGDIVNAKCLQAEKIVNRNSRGYVPGGVTAFVGSRYKPLNTAATRTSILRHCAINPGTTEFALLDEYGNFFKLDETGNFEVLSQFSSAIRKIRVNVTGSVDGDTLNVQSLSKF
jgi:hypothetical protein